MTESAEQLRFAVEAFLSELRSDTVSASRIVNPLLNLWQLASSIDPAAALPLEALLAVVPQRTLIARSELEDVLQQVLQSVNPVVEVSAD